MLAFQLPSHLPSLPRMFPRSRLVRAHGPRTCAAATASRPPPLWCRLRLSQHHAAPRIPMDPHSGTGTEPTTATHLRCESTAKTRRLRKNRSFHPITMSWQVVSELDKFNDSHHIFPKSFLPTLQPSKFMLSSSFSLLDLNLPFTYTDAHTTNKSTNLVRIFVVSILIRRTRFYTECYILQLPDCI